MHELNRPRIQFLSMSQVDLQTSARVQQPRAKAVIHLGTREMVREVSFDADVDHAWT